MFDHVGVQVTDVDASALWYARVLAPLGVKEAVRFPSPGGPVVGFAVGDGHARFWLSAAEDATLGRELHLAFPAASRAEVDQVYSAVLEAGTEVLHEPKLWPIYHEHYYGVFFRDFDGNNVEAVSHHPPS